MTSARWWPEGRMPSSNAVLKSASLHLPRPVSGSGVRLDPVTSNGGSLKRRPPDSALSNCGPFGPIGV